MAESHNGVQSIATVPAEVEDLLRQTMVLGLPSDDADKPIFYFDRQVTWADFDVEGQPWDWTTAPTLDTTPPPVSPICAYEFFSPIGRSGAQYSEVGDWFPSTVIITIMATDFPDILNSSYVTIGPATTKWWFRYYRPLYGLGGLDVYQITMQAEDTE